MSLHTLYQSIMLPSFEGLLGGGELGMVDAAGAAAGSDMVVNDKVGGGRAGDRRLSVRRRPYRSSDFLEVPDEQLIQ